MSVEHCFECNKNIDTDFDLDHDVDCPHIAGRSVGKTDVIEGVDCPQENSKTIPLFNSTKPVDSSKDVCECGHHKVKHSDAGKLTHCMTSIDGKGMKWCLCKKFKEKKLR